MHSQFRRVVETQPMKEAEDIHLDFERPWSPAMDVRVCDGQIIVYADLPGLDEKAIRVEEKNGSLYILGDRAFDHNDHCEEFVQVERFYGAFEGRVSLPPRAETSNLSKSYENGVLKLTVPLTRE